MRLSYGFSDPIVGVDPEGGPVVEPADLRRRADRVALVFEEASTPGNAATFVDLDIEPLTYQDLLSLDRTNPIPVPLSIRSARVHESTLPGVGAGARIRDGKCNLGAVYECRHIGLLDGGWLPPGIGLFIDPMVCLDQCTLSDLKGWFRDGHKTDPSRRDFIDFLTSFRVRINPFTYFLEGNQRRTPTRTEILGQFEEVVSTLENILPNAVLVPPRTSGLDGVLAFIEKTREHSTRQQRFLMETAQRLQSPVGRTKRESVWNRILATSRRHGLSDTSLPVIAALSCVVAPQGACPARRVLKPASGYTEQHAYNALADLQKLEILFNQMAIFPAERLMLCTQDVGLSLFWTALSAKVTPQPGNRMTLTFVWPNPLFPDVPDDWLHEQHEDLRAGASPHAFREPHGPPGEAEENQLRDPAHGTEVVPGLLQFGKPGRVAAAIRVVLASEFSVERLHFLRSLVRPASEYLVPRLGPVRPWERGEAGEDALHHLHAPVPLHRPDRIQGRGDRRQVVRHTVVLIDRDAPWLAVPRFPIGHGARVLGLLGQRRAAALRWKVRAHLESHQIVHEVDDCIDPFHGRGHGKGFHTGGRPLAERRSGPLIGRRAFPIVGPAQGV